MTKRNIADVLEKLNYDFDHFDLADFIDHIQRLRRREIILQEWRFEHELSALWVKADTADYIFFNADHHLIHQIHSVLHEIGHIVMGHKCHKLDEVLPADLLAQLKVAEPVGHTRVATPEFMKTPDEQEAEAFAHAIQQYVVHVQRVQSLVGRGSSSDILNEYVAGLAYNG